MSCSSRWPTVYDFEQLQNQIVKDGSEYFIDFTKILTVSKEYLHKETEAKKIKELSYVSWVLFHSCIIRYFARDDERND